MGVIRFRAIDLPASDCLARSASRRCAIPVACARLIGDLAVFTVETSGPALADALCAAGIDAEWARPPSGGEAVSGGGFMRSGVTAMSWSARDGASRTRPALDSR